MNQGGPTWSPDDAGAQRVAREPGYRGDDRWPCPGIQAGRSRERNRLLRDTVYRKKDSFTKRFF